MPGAEAVAQALQWRQEWRGFFTPIILGISKDFGFLTDVYEGVETTPEEFSQQARGLALPAWFTKRLEADAEVMEERNAPVGDEVTRLTIFPGRSETPHVVTYGTGR